MFTAATFLCKLCLLKLYTFPSPVTKPNNKRRYYRSHPTRSPIRHFAYCINVGSEVPPTTYSKYEVPRKSVNEFES